jgi:FMN phosphatase YigB (HAD superfamily)
MAAKIKWVGIDFGQCLMSPSSLRNPLIFSDIGKLLGKHEMIPVWIHRMRRLKEKYGNYSAIKEGHRDEIENYVLDGNKEAHRIFRIKEQEFLSLPPGAGEFISWLNQKGIKPDVVAELKKTLGAMGADIVTGFLMHQRITGQFRNLVTPQGKVDLATDARDSKYAGTSKETGTLYDLLIGDLAKEGIKPENCVMIGDKWSTDIVPAKQRGFTTIQYTGHIDMGLCESTDHYAKDFFEVKDIVEKLI